MDIIRVRAFLKKFIKAFLKATIKPVCNGCPLYSKCTSRYKEKINNSK